MMEATDQLAKLPKGWEWSKIGDFAEVLGGKRLPKGTSIQKYLQIMLIFGLQISIK
jgi:hypothetical protein